MVEGFEEDREEYVEEREYEGEVEDMVIVDEEGWFDVLEEREVDMVNVGWEEGGGEEWGEESGWGE